MPDAPPVHHRKEPLAELARLAYDFAPFLCEPAHGCQSYHRAWSLVRHYEADGALPLGLAFFRRELGLLAQSLGTSHLRLLISGAADTGVAAMLVQALQPLGIEPELVVVDRCNTTLMQQRIYLTLARVSAEFIHGDAVSADTAPVDAVISHSFIPFVPPERRPALFANWARLLRPEGRVLLSERMASESGMTTAWPDPTERQHRRAELAQKLVAEGLTDEYRKGFLEAAESLWDLTGQRHRTGIADFHQAVADAGLKVHSFDTSHSTKSVSPMTPRAVALVLPRHEIVLGLQ